MFFGGSLISVPRCLYGVAALVCAVSGFQGWIKSALCGTLFFFFFGGDDGGSGIAVGRLIERV